MFNSYVKLPEGTWVILGDFDVLIFCGNVYRNTWIWMALRIGDVYVLCWWFDARFSLGNIMWSIKVVVVGGDSFSFPLSNHTILGEWDWQAATCKGMICLFWFLRWCADLGAHGSAFLQVVLSFSAMCHGRRSPTHMSQIIHDFSGYGNKPYILNIEGNSVGIHGHVFPLFPDFKPGFLTKANDLPPDFATGVAAGTRNPTASSRTSQRRSELDVHGGIVQHTVYPQHGAFIYII